MSIEAKSVEIKASSIVPQLLHKLRHKLDEESAISQEFASISSIYSPIIAHSSINGICYDNTTITVKTLRF